MVHVLGIYLFKIFYKPFALRNGFKKRGPRICQHRQPLVLTTDFPLLAPEELFRVLL